MPVIFADLLPGETPIDTSYLLVPGISTRKELSIVEAKSIRKVLVKYFATKPSPEIAPFDFDWLYGLHREMYGGVWSWAGIFRTKELNIGVPFAQVQERLYNLLEDLKVWKESGMSLEEQATRLHHVAVQIHPFDNGNGRWGRMLTNLWLAIHDSPYVAWPEDSIGSVSLIRDEYIAALKEADNGDYDRFQAMHSAHMMDKKDLVW
jgi:Fic-DOC domain mobile mystery protein B